MSKPIPTSKSRLGRAALLLGGLPALAACSSNEPSDGVQSSALGWTHYHATVTEGGMIAEVDYWLRGDDVVRQYRRDGRLLFDERCEGKRLSIRQLPGADGDDEVEFSYKETSDRESPAACLAAATHDELSYLRAPEKLGKPERIALASGRAALRWIGPAGRQFVVDEATRLPVRMDYGSDESGGTTTLEFGKFSVAKVDAAPAAAEVSWVGFQDTRDVPASEAARALGLKDAPSTVAGLPLHHSRAFLTQNLSRPTYYLIWGNDARNVQLISTAATLPPELLGFSNDGHEYNAQEGERHVKVGVVGGDNALLRRVLATLRPAALEDERVAPPFPPNPAPGPVSEPE